MASSSNGVKNVIDDDDDMVPEEMPNARSNEINGFSSQLRIHSNV
jgi:hypothetical protein